MMPGASTKAGTRPAPREARKRLPRGQRGATAVEFALVLPLLVFFAVNMIEVGNIMLTWLSLQKGAQVGTRFATTGQGELEGNRTYLIMEKTKDVTGLDEGRMEVLVSSWTGLTDPNGGATGYAGAPCDTVKVEVRYEYEPITPVLDFMGKLGLRGVVYPDPFIMTASDMRLNEPWMPCE